MKRATIMLNSYIRALDISFFAVPVETAKCAEIAIVAPDIMAQCVENSAPVIERRKGELFARVKRLYTATKALPYYKPVARIETPYKHVKDFPIHAGMRARGFELVVCDALNMIGDSAIHSGDNISQVDVISKMFGNIECKTGTGKLYYAGGKKK